jgi:hypothetical protein
MIYPSSSRSPFGWCICFVITVISEALFEIPAQSPLSIMSSSRVQGQCLSSVIINFEKFLSIFVIKSMIIFSTSSKPAC